MDLHTQNYVSSYHTVENYKMPEILCDRLSSLPSEIFLHLIIRVNETNHSCHYSLPTDAEGESMSHSDELLSPQSVML